MNKELFCFHKDKLVREPMLLDDLLAECTKCKRQKRVSFDSAKRKKIITPEQYDEIKGDYH